jgi:hypothetical protein
LPFFKVETTTPLSLHKFTNIGQHKKCTKSLQSSQSKVYNLKTQKIALHNGMGLKFGSHFNFQELQNNSQIMNEATRSCCMQTNLDMATMILTIPCISESGIG